MKELNTVQILKQSLEYYYPGGWYFKPGDVPGVPCLNQGGVWIPMRFKKKNPLDILFYWKQELIAIEAKIFKNEIPVRFGDVKEHQAESLKRISMNEGNSFIAVHLKSHNLNSMYFIDINDWLHWEETYHKKSVRWPDFISDLHITASSTVNYGTCEAVRDLILGKSYEPTD